MAEKGPRLEIGGTVGALLVGGPLNGKRVPVRIGLNGLPQYLRFPDFQQVRVALGFPEYEADPFGDGLRVKRPEVEFVQYRLYDDWPVRYRFSGDDNDPEPELPDPVEPEGVTW